MDRDIAITDVCDFQGGTQPPKSEWSKNYLDGYVRMLQIRDFTQPNKNNIEYVKNNEKLKKCESEDILIGRYGASIGKILTGLSGAYNVAIVKTIPDQSKLYKPFLKHLLEGPGFQVFIKSIGSRAAQAGFNKTELINFKIHLPPLKTQKKIAAILDKADELRQNDKKILEKYDQLAQSVFLEMFGDTRLNPKKWKIKQIEEISSEIIDFPHSTPLYIDETTEYPCIRTTELRNGTIDWSSMKFLDAEGYIKRTKRLIPTQGDIVYGREGSFGEAAIIPPDTKISLGQRVMLFRPDYKIINSYFFLALIRSKGVYEQAVKKVSGSTVGHINIKDIRKFKCPLPPLDIQNHFEKVTKHIETQKQITQQSLQKSEELFQSLLQRAFRGELV